MFLNKNGVEQNESCTNCRNIASKEKKILFYSSDLCFLKYFIRLKMLIKRIMPFTWAYIYYWYAYSGSEVDLL